MTFYLKYRPKNLDELDLPEVGESLKKIVNSTSIPHALLFSGPKGTGKTSAARILAKIINCEHVSANKEPCDKCEQCISITKGNNLDVIEMDAASHRGIDDVRALRDAVKLAPTNAKKKIYIIDEAHMLTTEASNALLKTLEEPPDHVIFILATTNPEKLINTIRSRTTLIAFRKANISEITRSLKRVADSEKIKITEIDLIKIAEAADGAFRDAIKILEQYSLEGPSYLSGFLKSDLSEFIEFLVTKNEKAAIEEIENNISKGVSMENFLTLLLENFHKAILGEVGIGESKIGGLSKNDLLNLSDLFIEALRNLIDSPVEALPPEIAIVKWCSNKDKVYEERGNIEEIKPTPVKDKIQNSDTKSQPSSQASGFEYQSSVANSTSVHTVNDSIWQDILMAVRPVNASIEGLLRSSKPVAYDGKTLTLGVFYRFHKERLEDAHHKKILEEVIQNVLNNPTRIVCTLVEPPPKIVMQESAHEPVLTETKDTDIIKIAEDIFSN